MSNSLPPFLFPHNHPTFPSTSSNTSMPPLTTRSTHNRQPHYLASSPPRSSSPPRTPFSSKNHNHAYISSSPIFDSEPVYHSSIDYIDELPPIWHHSTHLLPVGKRPHANVVLPGLKDIFSDAASSTRSTSVNASSNSNLQAGYSREGISSRRPEPYVPVFYESEEEDQDDGSSLEEEQSRVTRFRISAERGQWKYDPIPFKPQPRPLLRKSAPTSSPPPLPGLHLPSRPISEPAPSLDRQLSPASPNSHEEAPFAEVPSSSSCVDTTTLASPDQFSPATEDTPCSLPSLTSDRESTEPEDLNSMSSPLLPPSSPPLSSPSVSPMMRSSSIPMSVDDDNAIMHTDINEIDIDIDTAPTPHPALPIPEPATKHQDGDQLHAADTCKADQHLDGGDPILEGFVEDGHAKVLSPALLPVSEVSGTFSSLGRSSEAENDVRPDAYTDITPPSVLSSPPEHEGLSGREELDGTGAMDTVIGVESGSVQPDGDGGHEVTVTVPREDEDKVEMPQAESSSSIQSAYLQPVTPITDSSDVIVEDGGDAASLKDERGDDCVHDQDVESKPGVLKEKRKNRHIDEEHTDRRVKKKIRVSEEPERESSRSVSPPPRVVEKPKKKSRKEVKRKEEQRGEEEEEENKPTSTKSKQQWKSDRDVSTTSKRARHHRSNSTSESKTLPITSPLSSSSKLPSSPTDLSKPSKASKQPPSHLRNSNPITETVSRDAELFGLLIESMASSRASCLPASTLYKSVTQCHPSFFNKEGVVQRSDGEWLGVIDRVLQSGEVSKGGSGVFGKVESSFKDESGRPLEARWFYVPELDEDQERATLIRSMMPRPGKRSETKKYKQYYYRPLDKISRWDPEDEI